MGFSNYFSMKQQLYSLFLRINQAMTQSSSGELAQMGLVKDSRPPNHHFFYHHTTTTPTSATKNQYRHRYLRRPRRSLRRRRRGRASFGFALCIAKFLHYYFLCVIADHLFHCFDRCCQGRTCWETSTTPSANSSSPSSAFSANSNLQVSAKSRFGWGRPRYLSCRLGLDWGRARLLDKSIHPDPQVPYSFAQKDWGFELEKLHPTAAPRVSSFLWGDCCCWCGYLKSKASTEAPNSQLK